MNATIEWSPDDVCLQSETRDVDSVAAALYQRTCRTDFSSPGFCLANAGTNLDSRSFRRLMVDLVQAMAVVHERTTGAGLAYLSAARFDQQTSTKPHLDGGPEESFLMLGYEPSDVESQLVIIDYARCANDLGLTPMEFMARHNPMFAAGYEMLRPYATRIPCFAPSNWQIVCINNSSAPLSIAGDRWQGVLHAATILAPDETKRRIINSTMIAPVGAADAISAEELREFLDTNVVRRSGYDKPHLDDDA